MEDVAEKAIERFNKSPDGIGYKHNAVDIADNKKNSAKKAIKRIIKEAKKHSQTEPWVEGAYFTNRFDGILDPDEVITLMHQWKDKKYIGWSNELSVDSEIYIKKEGELLEDINTRQSR